MDRLEDYIKKNRDSLDIREPSPEIWDRIGKDLNYVRRPVKKWLSVAASVIVITGISLIFYQLGQNSINGRMTTADGYLTSSQQLKEAEAFYTGQINSLYQEAEPMFTANPELQDELNSDISQIDSIFADLRKDLKDNIANQEVVEALIQNYLIKIKLLEEMLAILRENENSTEKYNNHEL